MARNVEENVKIARDLEALIRNRGRRIRPDVPGSRNRPAIPGVLSSGFDTVTDDTAGIASPLTEENANARTYFATPRNVETTDGLFMFELRDLNNLTMTDANGSEVVFSYDQPST